MTALTERPLPPPGPDGVNPSRARPAVRALYARPALTAGDLSAPLLILPDGHPGAGSLPGAVHLADVRRTVVRWREMGIRGVKAFAFGHDRDGAGAAASSADNLMVLAVSAAKAAAPDLAVTTEVCGCFWTSSGECVLRGSAGNIDPRRDLPADGRDGGSARRGRSGRGLAHRDARRLGAHGPRGPGRPGVP
ncbi:hypothetical protein GTY66_26615 [Streptomyces sp. SID8356]|nr:hypothetical protein [Streptomyces sp. SID8356]